MRLWVASLVLAASLSALGGPALSSRAQRPVQLDRAPSRSAPRSLHEQVREQIDGPRWMLYATEYARSSRLKQSRLIRGARPAARVDMSWYFFVAVGFGRVLLVDCGTDALAHPARGPLRSRWSIAWADTIDHALGRLGLVPEEVTDVVLTHAHWDHVGGLSALTRARVHSLRAIWRSLPRRLRAPVEAQGRLRSIALRARDGRRGVRAPGSGERFPSVEIAHGVRAIVAGGHTRHQLMVTVPCENGAHLVAGDAAYLYATIEEGRPLSVAHAPERNRRDLADLVETHGAGHILPGHDPQLFERHPSEEHVAAICQ